MAARTNQITVPFVLNSQGDSNFLANGVSNLEDLRLGVVDRFFSTADGDIGNVIIIGGFVNVDDGTREVFDFVDTRTSFAEDASDRVGRDSELEDVVGFLFYFKGFKQFSFGIGNAFLAALDENFVGPQLFPCLAFGISVLTGKSDLDSILLLKTNGIFALLTDEGGMVLVRNLKNFRSLVGLITS